jgi:hypothetical protein
VSDSHCQLVNCSAGTIAMAMTGTLRTVEMIRRWRSARTGASSSTSDPCALPAVPVGAGGVGRRAE